MIDKKICLILLILAASAFAQSPENQGLDMDGYLTVIGFIILTIVLVLIFVLAYTNYRNIKYEKKLLEEERVDLKKHNIQWEQQEHRKLEGFKMEEMKEMDEARRQIESERKSLDEDRKRLERDMKLIEQHLKELEEIKKQRAEDFSKIEEERRKIEEDKLRIEEEERKIDADRMKVDRDLKEIESMWVDVEKAARLSKEGKSR